MQIRVRFAPSPTGNVHIGNIRTAIFDWLFARHEKAKFLLRIEDTDRARSTDEAIRTLLECMEWLGLDYDEKELYQSAMLDSHKKAVEKFLSEGRALRVGAEGDSPVLFLLPRDITSNPHMREKEKVQITVSNEFPVEISRTGVKYGVPGKKGTVEQAASLAGFRGLKVYDPSGECVHDLEKEIEAIIRDRKTIIVENPAKLDFTRCEVFYHDIIKGELAKPLDSMKDFIIQRSDGTPVFHLANVCDDITQEISHIVRGDDHVENTYRHIFLFQALGAQVPKYAHLPMIVNQSGKPYSKRDGDAYVGDFRSKGFLPAALFNYLALLGWSPGDDREKMPRQEIIDAFTLDRVKSSPAQFDMNKLQNLNGQYIAEMDPAKFADDVRKIVIATDWGSSADHGFFAKVASLMQSRTKLLAQAHEWKYFFSDDFEMDKKAFEKIVLKDEIVAALGILSRKFAEITAFNVENIGKTLRSSELEAGLAEGKLNQPLRLVVSGRSTGAGIAETVELLGKDKTLSRLANT